MDKCKVCNSSQIVYREATQEFRCRKCGFTEKSSLPLSNRKKRVLSEITKQRIGNSMNKTWKRRKKNPEKDREYRETISKAMKRRAQQQNSD